MRASRVIATVFVALGVLVGCTNTGSEQPPAATDTPSRTQPVPDNLARFYEQDVQWSDCGDFQCTKISVPLDYADPTGQTISLAVIRRPADDSANKVGQLLVNPGGPGESGIWYASNAKYFFGDALLQHYDIVGWDPRGVGSSTAVECLTDQQTDQYLASDGTPDTPAEIAHLLALQRSFTRDCEQRSGSLIRHVGTMDSARDMDILRAALGEGRTDYFGASYGTELGATYADLFPERVGRMVLDGAVDPRLSSLQVAQGQLKGFERAVDAFINDCLARDGCPIGPTVADAQQQLTDLLNQADADPLPTDSDRPLTESLATTGMLSAMYDKEGGWPALRIGLDQALQGDGTQLLSMADAYSQRNSDGTYGSNINDAFPTISCTDRPETASVAKVKRLIPQYERISPVFGRGFAWSNTSCANWPVANGAFPQELTAKGASPILVVGTTRDPATPFEWAVGLARQLDSGVLLARNGDGHTAYHSGNDCIDSAIEDYLLTGATPPNRTLC